MGKNKWNFKKTIEGDFVKIEFKDTKYKTIFRKKFQVRDKNAWLEVMGIAESFGISFADLVKFKLENYDKWI